MPLLVRCHGNRAWEVMKVFTSMTDIGAIANYGGKQKSSYHCLTLQIINLPVYTTTLHAIYNLASIFNLVGKYKGSFALDTSMFDMKGIYDKSTFKLKQFNAFRFEPNFVKSRQIMIIVVILCKMTETRLHFT